MGVYLRVDQQWWKPWANTVLYLPLDWDVVDYSSAGRTFTVLGSWTSAWTPVFTTVQWTKKCASFTATNINTSDWFAYTTDVTWIPTSWNMTISFWMNWWGTVPTEGAPGSNYYQEMVSYRTDTGYTWMCMMKENTNVIMFHGSAQENSTFTPTVWTWYNITYTVDSWTCYIYKDWVQIYTDSYIYWSWANKLCLWWWYNNNPSKNYREEAYKWKLADVIIENVAWTSQEISDYYNLTKWNYGL